MKVRGEATYVADIEFAGGLEAAFVRSPHASATFTLGDLRGRVFGAAQLNLLPISIGGPGLAATEWPPLAVDRVRYVGEAVAVVLAEDRYRAEDLAESVAVDYVPVETASIHEGCPDDVLFRGGHSSGEVDAELARAAHVYERTFRTARQTALPLENRGVLARRSGERLEVWTSTQVPHLARDLIARTLDLAPSQVRVITPDVGGGFGLKAHVFPEELVIAALAWRLGEPVRWLEDRRENLLASAHAHDEVIRLKVGVAADGQVRAVDAHLTADVGAYSIFPFSASLEPMTTGQTLFGPYAVPAYRFSALGIASHKCPAGAYRGVGMNAAAYATERMIDIIAGDLGLDVFELRRRNVVTEFPSRTMAGRELDSGDYRRLLTELAERAGYGRLREEQARARAEGRLVGIGVGLFNEHSGTGSTEYRARGVTAIPGNDSARVRVAADGSIDIFTSSADAGQGHARTYRLLAARELGVDPARVRVTEGDTDSCPPGSGTFVSRGPVGGFSSLVIALRQVAERDIAPGLEVTHSVDPHQVFPSGAHLAVVEVDRVGFVPRILRYIAVEDCGVVVDHDGVAGQVEGGICMGAGGVLLEQIAYGPDGQPLTTTLLDYLVPLASDAPAELELHHIESPSPRTVLGSKGVGEGGTIGAFAAVANAVADALAPLGVTLTDLPYAPSALYQAVVDGASGPLE